MNEHLKKLHYTDVFVYSIYLLLFYDLYVSYFHNKYIYSPRDQVIPTSQKMVLDNSFLNTFYNKIEIKSKLSN